MHLAAPLLASLVALLASCNGRSSAAGADGLSYRLPLTGEDGVGWTLVDEDLRFAELAETPGVLVPAKRQGTVAQIFMQESLDGMRRAYVTAVCDGAFALRVRAGDAETATGRGENTLRQPVELELPFSAPLGERGGAVPVALVVVENELPLFVSQVRFER